jgi:hypothetical protein
MKLDEFVVNVLPWKTWTWCLLIITVAQMIQCARGV